MPPKITHTKVGTILAGVAALVLGAMILANPGGSMLAVTGTIGWVLVIFGVVTLINGAATHSLLLSQLDLYVGVLSLLFGILIVSNPGFFVAWIFILLGIYVLFAGFDMLLASGVMRGVGLPGRWSTMLGIITIILGVVVITSPFSLASAAMLICGVVLVYTGATTMLAGFKMPKD